MNIPWGKLGMMAEQVAIGLPAASLLIAVVVIIAAIVGVLAC